MLSIRIKLEISQRTLLMTIKQSLHNFGEIFLLVLRKVSRNFEIFRELKLNLKKKKKYLLKLYDFLAPQIIVKETARSYSGIPWYCGKLKLNFMKEKKRCFFSLKQWAGRSAVFFKRAHPCIQMTEILSFSQKKQLIQAHSSSSRLIQAHPGSSRLIQAQFCLSNGKNWFPFNRMTWFIVMISHKVVQQHPSRILCSQLLYTPTLSLTRAPVLGLWKLGAFSENRDFSRKCEAS